MFNTANMSHPVWVRGLKPKFSPKALTQTGSHPVWVRGLKQFQSLSEYLKQRRTPCGCVD